MQSKLASKIEVMVGIAIGFCVALMLQVVMYAFLNIPVSIGQNLLLTSVFTAASIIRGYYVRRLFNYLHSKGILV